MRTEDKIISVAIAKTETREEDGSDSENEVVADLAENSENN